MSLSSAHSGTVDIVAYERIMATDNVSITLTTNDNMFSFLFATTCRCRVYVHVHVRSTMITDSTRKAAHGGVHVRTLKTSGSLGPIFWKHSVRGSGMLLVPGCTGPINELPPPPAAAAPGLGVGPGLSGSGIVLLLNGPGMGIVSGLVTDSTLSLMAFSASIASFSIRAAMSWDSRKSKLCLLGLKFVGIFLKTSTTVLT